MTVVLPDDGRLANLQGTVNGQNCVGVLSPDTRVQGGGDALSGDQANVRVIAARPMRAIPSPSATR